MVKISKILQKIRTEEPIEEPTQPAAKFPTQGKTAPSPIKPEVPAKERKSEESLKERIKRLEEEKRKLEKRIEKDKKEEHIKKKPEVAVQKEKTSLPPSEKAFVPSNEKVSVPPSEKAPVAAKAEAVSESELFYKKALDTLRKNFELVKDKKDIHLEEIIDIATECIKLFKKDPHDLLWKASQPEHYTQLINSPLNICIYSISIGIALSYDDSQLEELALAVLLHDIGIIAMLDSVKSILEYPKVLTKAQRETINGHVKTDWLGKLREKGLSDATVTAIMQHHERTDGSGYPLGLKGNEICEYARILAEAESLEAMCHPRPYKKQKSFHEAVKEMAMSRKGQYDPYITKALIKKIGIYPVGTMVELDTGEVARVEKNNEQYPLCPIVRVEAKYADGEMKLKEPYYLDLAEHPSIYIKREITGIAKETTPEKNPFQEIEKAIGFPIPKKLAKIPFLEKFAKILIREKLVAFATIVLLLIVVLLLIMK